MIEIRQNSNNNYCFFTLTEDALFDPPHYWIFAFTNTMTNTTVSCSAEDLSDYPDRYNYFRFRETGSIDISEENALLGYVRLRPAGEWVYKVYQTLDSSSIAIPTGTFSKVRETGILQVIGSSEDNITDTYTNTKTYTVYQG